MAWLGHYWWFYFCMVADVAVVGTQTLPFQEYGVVIANNGTFRFVGDSLELYCNITSTSVRENSSMLHFERHTKKDKSVIPSNYIEILTTKTIRLRLLDLDTGDDGVYTCFQQTFSGDTRVIGSQIIEVDYKPQKVKDISCRVYNWEQMNCTWDLGVKFQHPENVRVSLAWTIHGEQQDCPELTHTSCFWNVDNYSNGHQYLMVVEVSTVVDGKELLKERSPQFRIETQLYVEPAPVRKLQAAALNSSCIELSWQDSATDRQKFFVAESRVAGEEKWNQIIVNQDTKKHSPVCNLIPFTNYEFRMSVLPYPVETKEPVNQGHRSEWKMVSAQTWEDVPGAAPKICGGCFYEFKCSQNESLRCVQIFWQDLKKTEKHGIIRNVSVRYASSDTGISNSLLLPVPESKSLTSANLKLPTVGKNFKISITLGTSKGFSRISSSLLLPSVQRKPNPPLSFLVEVDKNNDGRDVVFYLSWAALNADAKTGLKYVNVTIVWCHGNRQTLCSGNINWVQLPADHVTYELKPRAKGHHHSDFLIGINAEVSSQGQVLSSGIYWSTCTYFRNEQPQNPPKNVHESLKHPVNGLTILWDKFECSEEKSFITEYLVKYCPSYDGTMCKEAEKSMNVSNTAREVTLEHLKEDVKYKVTIIAVSTAGLGPSTPILTESVKGSPPDQDVRGTVGITVGLFLLILVGIIVFILIRNCLNRKKQIPSTDDFISPYEQSSGDFSNKIRHGFRNRPLPKTPEEQHFYGSSACMNNHGSDKTKDNNNSESFSEESVTSQSNLLSSPAEISHNPPTAAVGYSHITDVAYNISKENGFSTKERMSLLDHSSGNINGSSDRVQNSRMLEPAAGSAAQVDYCTLGYVDKDNDIHNSVSQNSKLGNASDQSNSSNTAQSSLQSLASYHQLGMSGPRYINPHDESDPNVQNFSNTNTLPLRGHSMEISACPVVRTRLPMIDPLSSSVLVGHGQIAELNPELAHVKHTPRNSAYVQRCQMPSSHFHREALPLSLTPNNSHPFVNLSGGGNSEYVAHSHMGSQPSDLPQNNQSVGYSKLMETPDSQRHSIPLGSFLHFSLQPVSSPPSPCPEDTHFIPSVFSSRLNDPRFQCSSDDICVLEQDHFVNINDYTPLDAFPKVSPFDSHSALSPYLTSAPVKEITAQSSFDLNFSPTSNPDIYVHQFPHVSSLIVAERIPAARHYEYNSTEAATTLPRTAGRESAVIPLPSPLTRPLSGDLLQLPSKYYEEPKLEGSNQILTEL